MGTVGMPFLVGVAVSTEQHRAPLEETPEVAAAVADDTTVPQLITGGGPDADTPEFRAPTEPGADPDRPDEAPH